MVGSSCGPVYARYGSPRVPAPVTRHRAGTSALPIRSGWFACMVPGVPGQPPFQSAVKGCQSHWRVRRGSDRGCSAGDATVRTIAAASPASRCHPSSILNASLAISGAGEAVLSFGNAQVQRGQVALGSLPALRVHGATEVLDRKAHSADDLRAPARARISGSRAGYQLHGHGTTGYPDPHTIETGFR